MVYQALSQFGCFVALSSDKKTIFTIPMDDGGDLNDEEPTEITAPEEDFLVAVNKMFKTNFQMSDFPGR